MRARAPPLIFLALLSLAGASAPPRFVLRLLAELPDGRGTGLCGATLLGPREALTAAHCVFFGGAASPFVLVRHPETGFYSRATARAARAPAGDLALLRGGMPGFLYLKWGEKNGAQDSNKDRSYLSTSSRHNVDYPEGLGSFSRIDSQTRSVNVGIHNDAAMSAPTGQSYTIWVRQSV